VIGLRGVGDNLAVLDSICVETICIPEPGTLALLGLGIFGVIRSKRKSV